MKYKLLIILAVFCFFSCKDKIGDESKRNEDWVWWVDAKTGKANWIPVNKGEPVKNGKYTRFYFNGNVYQKGRLVDGMNVDTIFYYDIKGKLEEYSIVKSDTTIDYYIKNGQIQMFFSNGRTIAIGVVKNHQMGDKWKCYFKNGNIFFIRNFKSDTGWLTRYYENGKVKDSDYCEGANEYNIKHWYENGQLDSCAEFKAGNYNGIGKKYFPNGKLKAIGNYVNAKVDGEERLWYENGKPHAFMHRKNGILNGRQLVYYENGNIQLDVNGKNGKADGERKKYAENGMLIADEILKDGVIIKDKMKDSTKKDYFFKNH